jgi:hypothetical protein
MHHRGFPVWLSVPAVFLPASSIALMVLRARCQYSLHSTKLAKNFFSLALFWGRLTERWQAIQLLATAPFKRWTCRIESVSNIFAHTFPSPDLFRFAPLERQIARRSQ